MARFVDLSDGSTVISSQKEEYKLEKVVIPGDLSDIYRSEDSALKVSKQGSLNGFLSNEASILSFVLEGTDPKRRRYFPELKDSCYIKVGAEELKVNVLGWLSDFYTLEQIRTAHPEGLRFEHGVWMLNRILEGLDFLSTGRGIIHGGILPPHVMVFASSKKEDPLTHGAKLLDFTASKRLGKTSPRLELVSSKWKAFYPPEVFKKEPATPATDVYMAVKSIIYVLGGDAVTNELPATVPDYLSRFLRACVDPKPGKRPKEPWSLHEELAGLMERHFGPKKYIHFEMPAK